MPKNSDDLIDELKDRTEKVEEQILKPYATLSSEAIRKSGYGGRTLRPEFCRDADRIIHSLSFSRFADKTQVFFWVDSDLFQHRLMHVQLVSKIARYCAKILGLNEDLVEAISLGHDIGHCPFGHDGERFLSELCRENGIGFFRHNYESVWFLQEIEMQNLTLQTLDGILCHNGEIHKRKVRPDFNSLSWNVLKREMQSVQSNTRTPELVPKSMEAALVSYVDTISYISRDIREAESLGLVSFRDLPSNVKETLGASNREIINSLITDLINNSIDQDYIAYSQDTLNSLLDLYDFNYRNIYSHPKKKAAYGYLKSAFRLLWDKYLDDLEMDNRDSAIFYDHFKFNLKDIKSRYSYIKDLEDYPYYQMNKNDNPKVVVRDFIAGMTDGYFQTLVGKLNPRIVLEKERMH